MTAHAIRNASLPSRRETLFDFIWEYAERNPTRPALVDASPGEAVSYCKLKWEVETLARQLPHLDRKSVV